MDLIIEEQAEEEVSSGVLRDHPDCEASPDADAELFMKEAIAEARLAYLEGEVPVGAVIVKDGRIISRGHNRSIHTGNPLMHAEISVINDALSALGVQRLSDCDMYVTLEPCAMCAGAIVLAKIKRLYIGTADPKSGACISLNNITTDSRLNHRVELHSGILQGECSSILKDFFRQLRSKSKERTQQDKIQEN